MEYFTSGALGISSIFIFLPDVPTLFSSFFFISKFLLVFLYFNGFPSITFFAVLNNSRRFDETGKWLNHKSLVIKPFMASLSGFEPLTFRLGEVKYPSSKFCNFRISQ